MTLLTTQALEALKEKGTIESIYYETTKYGDTWVGFKYKNSCVFHWFEHYVLEGGDMDQLWFKQSYSQRTGATKKGTFYGMDLVDSLKKKIEKLNK
tara:strand:+ start:1693 stop:1980 length:288 start_codon:yes stop_codon:yes gene_type:complete